MSRCDNPVNKKRKLIIETKTTFDSLLKLDSNIGTRRVQRKKEHIRQRCILITPVFGIGGGFSSVKRQKALRVRFFRLRGLESYWEFFSARGRPVTGFVRNVFCICAARFI